MVFWFLLLILQSGIRLPVVKLVKLPPLVRIELRKEVFKCDLYNDVIGFSGGSTVHCDPFLESLCHSGIKLR